MTSQLQIALISKRFELPGWDWSHMKDLLKLLSDLTNFSHFSSTNVGISLFSRLVSGAESKHRLFSVGRLLFVHNSSTFFLLSKFQSSFRWLWHQRTLLGDELQLKISRAESRSRFENNSPLKVSRVTTGVNHHWSRRSWFCSTEICFLLRLLLTKLYFFLCRGP